MKPTFITSGTVETVYHEDGTVFGFNVGRKNSGSIFLTSLIDEFHRKGIRVYVDKYGSYWTKKA